MDNDAKSIEVLKLEHEFTKHLATLNTASILLVATFLEKLFNQPKGKMYVIAALCLFSISLFAVTVYHFLIVVEIRHLPKGSSPGKIHREVESDSIALALVAFLVGLLLLAIFAVTNLY